MSEIKLKCYFCKKPIKIPDEYFDGTDKYCCGNCLETKAKEDPDNNWREMDYE